MALNIKDELTSYINDVLSDYGIVIASLTLGIIIGWYIKFLLADRSYNKQIEIRFEEKDQRIAELNYMVLERLNKVKVKKKDKTFFKRLKKSFKKYSTKNK